MIKISVLYPNGDGHVFDMSYCLAKHVPLVRRLSGTALRRVEVEEGIGGLAAPCPTSRWGIYSSSRSKPSRPRSHPMHAPAITGDIPNYTNTQPTIQISEVKLF